MSTRILYTTNNVPLGSLLASVVRSLVEDKARLNSLYQAMDAMAQGATYDSIEQEMGIVAGSGQAAYNIVTGIKVALDASAFNDLPKLYKG
jgi:hypothetical protein